MKKQYYLAAFLSIGMITACSDDEVKTDNPSPSPEPSELPDWYYTGGELGTTFNSASTAFEDPTPVVDADADMTAAFNRGEQFFEKPYTSNFSGMRHGLGPVYIRTSCQHCHPGYGHGQSQPTGTFNKPNRQRLSISCLRPGYGCLRILACRYASNHGGSTFQISAGRNPNPTDLA